MSRHTTRLLSAALALALGGAAMFVHAQADAPPRDARMRLDADGDGAVDRSEAAKAPKLAERFDGLDTDRDGRLERDELRALRDDRGRRERHDPAALDADRDGRLSRAEVAAHPRLAERFDEIDRNRDGALTRSELRTHHEQARTERRAEREKEFDARYTAADTNRDGRISRGEAEAGLPHVAERFAWHDENRDGYLTREDLREAK